MCPLFLSHFSIVDLLFLNIYSYSWWDPVQTIVTSPSSSNSINVIISTFKTPYFYIIVSLSMFIYFIKAYFSSIRCISWCSYLSFNVLKKLLSSDSNLCFLWSCNINILAWYCFFSPSFPNSLSRQHCGKGVSGQLFVTINWTLFRLQSSKTLQ